MTTVRELLDELRQDLTGRSTTYTTASAANDVYEGYVFGLVVRAAVAAGGQVRYENVHGRSTGGRLVFRTSPGMLYSVAHPYTHAVIEFQDCPHLEVHVGVRVQGRSRVLHECDVLVVPRSEAEISRTKQVVPRGSRALIAVECKFYSNNLALHLARGFHGLHADLGLKNPFFVSNVRSGSVERFLTHHKRQWENGVAPNANEATYLVGAFREAFKRFQAAEAP